jgi:hypothetical protein
MLRERTGANEHSMNKLIIAALSVFVVPAAVAAQPDAAAPFRAGAARIDFTPSI